MYDFRPPVQNYDRPRAHGHRASNRSHQPRSKRPRLQTPTPSTAGWPKIGGCNWPRNVLESNPPLHTWTMIIRCSSTVVCGWRQPQISAFAVRARSSSAPISGCRRAQTIRGSFGLLWQYVKKKSGNLTSYFVHLRSPFFRHGEYCPTPETLFPANAPCSQSLTSNGSTTYCHATTRTGREYCPPEKNKFIEAIFYLSELRI
jgi:hypothetical protein